MAEVTHEVEAESIASAETPEPYIPRIYLEVSKEQLDMLEIGKSVTMKILGRVKALSADQRDKHDDKYEIQLELKEVKIDSADNKIAALLDDDE